MSYDLTNEGQTAIAKIESAENPTQRRTQVTDFLSSFLSVRLTPDELLSAKIIQERPGTEVPIRFDVVVRCCEWIAAHALDVEGIFRISGPTQEVAAVADLFISGCVEFGPTSAPHTVASSLKYYLRERTFPVIPYRCFKSALQRHAKLKAKMAEYSPDECRQFIESLPSEKRSTLVYLLRFMIKVAEHSGHNKMGLSNLAIVWGPVLMKTRVQGLDSLSESECQVELLSSLLMNINSLEATPPPQP